MYDFGITHTWNPLAGECSHKCSYCSTNRLKKRFPALKEKYSGKRRLTEDALKTNLGSGNFIFVVAQNDLFAEDSVIIAQIINKCIQSDDINEHKGLPLNKFLFQTKNPYELYWCFPKNTTLCITLETNKNYPTMHKAPLVEIRSMEFADIIHKDKMITIEPIMDFDLRPFVEMIKSCRPIQVNIGANTSNIKLPEPTKEETLALIRELKKFTKVHLKSNLDRIIK